MPSRSSDLRPALAASVALHLAIIVAALIAMRSAPPIESPPVATPVTIVTTAGEANVRPAAQAPTDQTAAAPTPSPPTPEPPAPVETPTPQPAPPPPEPTPRPPRHHRQATSLPQPAPPPPAPEPTPTPRRRPRPQPTSQPSPEPAPVPQPKPRPKPKPEPASRPEPAPKPKPKPVEPPPPDLDLSSLSKTTPKHAAKSLDLSSLTAAKSHPDRTLDLAALSSRQAAKAAQADLDLSSLAAGGHRARAAKGPARPQTARAARQAAGAATALTGDQIGALKEKLNRLWHPNCGVEGAAGVDIKVELRLTPDHQLASPPRVLGKTSAGAGEAVVEAAARRALTAAAEGAPYTELPRSASLDFALHFDAKQACGG